MVLRSALQSRRPPALKPPPLDGLSAFFPDLYEQLRSLAQHRLQGERGQHMLQPTALVHEAYLRLAAQRVEGWQSKRHFVAMASLMMRRVLVDYARAHQRRSANSGRLMLEEELLSGSQRLIDLLSLDEALSLLASAHPRKARLIELRFFGGLTMHECSKELGIYERVAADDWSFARAWLRREMHRA